MIRAVTHKPFVVFSVNDPAIDRDSPEGLLALTSYALERDESKLVLLPGATPTRFMCRPLSHGARLWVESFVSDSSRFVAAFRSCVTAIDGMELDGAAWQAEVQAAGWPNGQLLTDPCVARLCDAGLGKVVEEVGFVALTRATLDANQKKAYRLPLGFVLTQPRISGVATIRSAAASARPPSGATPAAASPPTTSPSTAEETPADSAELD
jgi:hypothetical protein